MVKTSATPFLRSSELNSVPNPSTDDLLGYLSQAGIVFDRSTFDILVEIGSSVEEIVQQLPTAAGFNNWYQQQHTADGVAEAKVDTSIQLLADDHDDALSGDSQTLSPQALPGQVPEGCRLGQEPPAAAVDSQVSLDDEIADQPPKTIPYSGVAEVSIFRQKAQWNIARNRLWAIAWFASQPLEPILWQVEWISKVYRTFYSQSFKHDYLAAYADNQPAVRQMLTDWLQEPPDMLAQDVHTKLRDKVTGHCNQVHAKYQGLCREPFDMLVAGQVVHLATAYKRMKNQFIGDVCPTPASVNATISVTVDSREYHLQAFATLADGNCGFYSLFPGDLYPRHTACEAVLRHQNDAACRTLLAPEIIAAIRVWEFTMPEDAEYEGLIERCNKQLTREEHQQLDNELQVFAESPKVFVAYVQYVEQKMVWLQFEHDRAVRATGLIDLLATIYDWCIVVWEIFSDQTNQWQGRVRSIINPTGATQKHIRHRFHKGMAVLDHFEQMDSSAEIPVRDLQQLRHAEYLAWIKESALFNPDLREVLTASVDSLEWSNIVDVSGQPGAQLNQDFIQWQQRQRQRPAVVVRESTNADTSASVTKEVGPSAPPAWGNDPIAEYDRQQMVFNAAVCRGWGVDYTKLQWLGQPIVTGSVAQKRSSPNATGDDAAPASKVARWGSAAGVASESLLTVQMDEIKRRLRLAEVGYDPYEAEAQLGNGKKVAEVVKYFTEQGLAADAYSESDSEEGVGRGEVMAPSQKPLWSPESPTQAHPPAGPAL